MNTNRIKRVLVAFLILLGIATITTLVRLSAVRDRARQAVTSAALTNLAEAFTAYEGTYGHFPTGSTSTVTSVLLGSNFNNQNPQRIVFWTIQPRPLSRGAPVDGWGNQIRFDISNGHITAVTSAGLDGKYNTPSSDDVIVPLRKSK